MWVVKGVDAEGRSAAHGLRERDASVGMSSRLWCGKVPNYDRDSESPTLPSFA